MYFNSEYIIIKIMTLTDRSKFKWWLLSFFVLYDSCFYADDIHLKTSFWLTYM